MFVPIRQFLKRFPAVRRAVNAVRGRRLHRPETSIDDTYIGSDYGGWSLPLKELAKEAIVYSFGVGEDLSFDLALISAVGCNVHAFDPTPIAVNWVHSINLPSELQFQAVGVSDVDGLIDFYLPPRSDWHSYSRTPEPTAIGRDTIQLPVKTLSSIMTQLGHSRLDVLKLDIEGFEYAVLRNMIESNVSPTYLLVEFHHQIYGITTNETIDAVAQLKKYGYVIYWVSDGGHEYGFMKKAHTHNLKTGSGPTIVI